MYHVSTFSAIDKYISTRDLGKNDIICLTDDFRHRHYRNTEKSALKHRGKPTVGQLLDIITFEGQLYKRRLFLCSKLLHGVGLW